MPSDRDLEKIERMVDDLGDVEKKLGTIDESYLEKGSVKEKERNEELNELLEDIAVGLEEEKELEGEEVLKEKVEKPKEERVEEEKLSEEKISENEEMSVEAEAEEVISEKVEESEIGKKEAESNLDLPEDFDIEKLTKKEEPPEGFFKSDRKREEKIEEEEAKIESPEEALTRELEGIIEGIEEGEEEVPESFETAFEEEKSEIEKPEEELSMEEVKKEEEAAELEKESKEVEPPSKEIPEMIEEELEEEENVEEIEKEEEKKEGEEEVILEEELPEIEDIISEAEEEAREEPIEVEEEIKRSEAAPPTKKISGLETGEQKKKEFDLELSDEDIILITTKLKQITPELAVAIRDSILQSEIPADNLKGLLELLIRDAPEEEIKSYYESLTGKKLAIKRIPEVIRVKKRPGPLAAVYENLAPMVRITALGVMAIAIIISIFMLFFYKPIKANKYYKSGIVYLKEGDYELADQNFKKGQNIYSRLDEYDIYGWEYMLMGNYDKAEEKFKEGIKKDKRYKVLLLRVHLAKLYSIQGDYKEADDLYSELLKQYPKKYEYVKLKGLNLIAWGKINKNKLEEAYTLFSEANKNFPKESDAVIRMLYISILQDKFERVKKLYDYLNENYPNKYDSFVHSKLASYFVDKNEFTLAKQLLMELLAKFPNYPQIYYAYARYYEKIETKKDQEMMLKMAISKEESRKILYPWDARNRNLLSNAYNDLGKLYDNLEIPGKSAEAIRYFKKAIEENPSNKEAYFNIAQVYFYKEKDYKLAERYYLEARKKGFENKDLVYNLGILSFYKEDFSNAINYWIRLSERIPGNPNVSFALACAFLHMKKYNAALGELLNLSEIYDGFIKELGEIKPWKAYHKRILLNAAGVYNNLGVAYEKLYERTKNIDYQKKSLVSLYKAGEFADVIGIDRGTIQYNINYILHPNVIRADMAISDNVCLNYRFIHQ